MTTRTVDFAAYEETVFDFDQEEVSAEAFTFGEWPEYEFDFRQEVVDWCASNLKTMPTAEIAIWDGEFPADIDITFADEEDEMLFRLKWL